MPQDPRPDIDLNPDLPGNDHAGNDHADLSSADLRGADAGVVYSEKLWVPLWWWPVGLAIGALLAAEVHMGAPGIRAWLPYVLLLPFPLWAMYWLSRMRVEVIESPRGGELRVGRAHLPLEVVAKAATIPAAAKSAALGRQLDPLAFVQHRTWVKQMVLIVLDDPDDPTPYWLVSTKRPDELVAALSRTARNRI